MNWKFWKKKKKVDVGYLEFKVEKLEKTVGILADLLRLDGRPFDGASLFTQYFTFDNTHTIDLGKGVKRTLNENPTISETKEKK